MAAKLKILRYRTALTGTILKGTHPGTIPARFGLIWFSGFRKGDDIFKKSSPLKLLSQSQPNFAEMILGWYPSKIVSGISDLQPRWPSQPNLI
jgi:hypothetical protein